MSIRLSACFAFVAAFFGLALTATTPAHAYVEAGIVELSEPGAGRLCCRIVARFRLRFRAGLRRAAAVLSWHCEPLRSSNRLHQ